MKPIPGHGWKQSYLSTLCRKTFWSWRERPDGDALDWRYRKEWRYRWGTGGVSSRALCGQIFRVTETQINRWKLFYIFYIRRLREVPHLFLHLRCQNLQKKLMNEITDDCMNNSFTKFTTCRKDIKIGIWDTVLSLGQFWLLVNQPSNFMRRLKSGSSLNLKYTLR